MNRRSFFRRLLGTAAAITMASAVEVFGISDKAIETAKQVKRVIVNPAYLTATYEDIIIFHRAIMRSPHVLRVPTALARETKQVGGALFDPRPARYNEEGGSWVQVPFYKEDVS